MRSWCPLEIGPYLRDQQTHPLSLYRGTVWAVWKTLLPRERLTFVYVAWARDNKQVCSPLAFRNSPAARKDREAALL